ncbi:MAG: M23 family metallopeptidase [Acidimicrobiia bacterium]
MGRNRRTVRALVVALSALGLALLALPAGAADSDTTTTTGVPSDTGTPTITAFDAFPLNPVQPVLGADDQQHLAYELRIANVSQKTITMESVDVLDAANTDDVLQTVDAATITNLLHVDGGGLSNVVPPGTGGTLFFDVTFAKGAKIPPKVLHHFTYTLSDTAPLTTDAPGVSDGAAEASTPALQFIGVPETVENVKAVVVSPPLKGKGWVIGNGCCDAVTAHRGATLPIDGTIHVPERYAIDFVQLNDSGTLFDGPLDDNASYGYFGDEIYSAAAGKVVEVQDGLPEQTPGKLPEGATVQTAGGNYAVIDIGNGHYAFYAHMQPGSIKVKVGQKVKTGQVIGLLGNTGNTDGAHLHFHVMDGPSPLLANGVPFVFTSFTGEGVVTNIGDVQTGATATIQPQNNGPHTKELPLNNEVIDFGS